MSYTIYSEALTFYPSKLNHLISSLHELLWPYTTVGIDVISYHYHTHGSCVNQHPYLLQYSIFSTIKYSQL